MRFGAVDSQPNPLPSHLKTAEEYWFRGVVGSVYFAGSLPSKGRLFCDPKGTRQILPATLQRPDQESISWPISAQIRHEKNSPEIHFGRRSWRKAGFFRFYRSSWTNRSPHLRR